MIVIGISGQTGAGKTTFANSFKETFDGLFSVIYIDVDSLGHKVLNDSETIGQLTKAFGEDILTDSKIDRKKLGAKVFVSQETTELLNSIMHPRMVKIVEDIIKTNKENTRGKIIIIDAALLYKMNLARLCDKIIYVEADPEVRVKRLISTRGMTEKRARERLFAQDKEPLGKKIILPTKDLFTNIKNTMSFFKKKHNLLIIENNGSKEKIKQILLLFRFFFALLIKYLKLNS